MFLGILNKFTIDTQVNATESLIYLTMNVVALTVSHMKLTPSLSNQHFHSLKFCHLTRKYTLARKMTAEIFTKTGYLLC